MKPLFKPAGKEDMEKLLIMMERFYRIDEYAFNARLTEKNINTFISNPGLGKLWIIELDDRAVGYLILTFGFSFEFGGRNAFIDELFIEEDFRGQGIGTQVIAFALQEADKLDVKAVHLEVERHNEAGKRLYRKFQFTDHDRHLMTRKIAPL